MTGKASAAAAPTPSPPIAGHTDGALGHPHYFGPVERRRFSFVHWPADAAVRGAVVICPPLAYEAVCAHASLRLLAERLAAIGVVAMRIDYDGTANSVGGDHDEGRVAAWRQTIDDAVAELRGWGVGPTHLVGLRFGATLASTASSAPTVAGAVYWDPVLSGRRYSRELQLLSGSSGLRPDPTLDGISVAGVRLSAATLADLKRVDLQPPGGPCLVISRAERAEEPTSASVGDLGPAAEWRSLPGTPAMLDTDVELSVTPHDILTAIVGWVDHHLPSSTAFLATPALTAEAVEPAGPTSLEHRADRIGRDVFQIETTARGVQPEQAVIMVNNGVAPLIGPGRSWVELAAEVAARGWTAVRMDLNGIGDTPARLGQAPDESYPAEAGLDIAEVVERLRAKGVHDIAVVGLCSGALMAFDGAVATDGIDTIVSINGRFDRPFFDRRRDRRFRAAPHTPWLVSVPLRKTPLLGWFAKVPTVIWRVLDRTRIVPDPTHAIRRYVAARRPVLMIFGEREWGLIALRQRGGRRFTTLQADPLVTTTILPGLDHSMFDLAARTEVLDRVTGYLTELWAPRG